jgi:hypothetical protein
MMRIAGGEMRGIHGFHLSPGVVVEYRSDPGRQTIPWVRYTSPAGESTEYAAPDWDPAKAAQYELRVMDCIDCHNRPTHTFYPVDRALDRALAGGSIDPSLPGVKAKGMEILKSAYASTSDAEQQIPEALAAFYRTEHPEVYGQRREAVEKSARGLLAAWKRNIFPEMNVTWGAYPSHIGHTDFPGCYRCHDDQHASAAGKTITQDCAACHEMLAWDESNPEILSRLGIAAAE